MNVIRAKRGCEPILIYYSSSDGKKQECACGNRRGGKMVDDENRDETYRRAAKVYTIESPSLSSLPPPDAS